MAEAGAVCRLGSARLAAASKDNDEQIEERIAALVEQCKIRSGRV